MSNIYQDKFGIGNESLYDILSQGEDYFIKKEGTTLKGSQLCSFFGGQ